MKYEQNKPHIHCAQCEDKERTIQFLLEDRARLHDALQAQRKPSPVEANDFI